MMHAENDDASRAVRCQHPAQELEPAGTFEIEIEHDDVRPLAFVDREAVVDVRRFDHLRFEMRDEQPLQAFANDAVIVNDEDFHAALGVHASSLGFSAGQPAAMGFRRSA